MLRIALRRLPLPLLQARTAVVRQSWALHERTPVFGSQYHASATALGYVTDKDRKRLDRLFRELGLNDENDSMSPSLVSALESPLDEDDTDGSANEQSNGAYLSRYERMMKKLVESPDGKNALSYLDLDKIEDSVPANDDRDRGRDRTRRVDDHDNVDAGRDNDDEDEMDENPDLNSFLIEVRRVVNQTGGGKVQSYAAVVAVGNGNGACGFARGKSYDPNKAIAVAYRRAARRLQFIPRYNEHTINHGVNVKYEQTRLYMRPRPRGSGLTAHTIVQRLCELSGIYDISANIVGSTNKLNIVRAWFEAVQKQRTVEEVCQARGKNVITFKRSVKVSG